MISALRQLNHSIVRRFTKRNNTTRTARHTRQDTGTDQGCDSRSCPLDKNFALSVEKKNTGSEALGYMGKNLTGKDPIQRR